MKKNNLLIINFLIILFSSTSCKTLQIEKPNESYLPSSLTPALSEIPLQVEIDLKKLEVALNSKMNGLIYEGSNISNQDLSLKIWKAQNFSFTVNNNVIEYQVPLKIWSRFAWQIQKFGFTVSDHYEASGSIALGFKTTIGIDKYWRLVSHTTTTGYRWIETPKLSLIGITVPVTPIANLALSQSQQYITAQIDKTLAQSVDLKKYVSLVWTEVQKPRLLSADNNLWMRVTPKEIYVSPLTTVANRLKIAVALTGQIESFMGAQPPTNPEVKLPDFNYVAHTPQAFNLNVATDVTFAKISEMANQELLNKTFKQGNKTITIKSLSIYGSNGKAVFVADVTGSLKGRIYFTGIMSFNPDKQTVEISQPAFDINTQNALVKSASWLLHGMILKQISPYLSYSVKSYLDQMKADANKMLANYPVYQGISLQGKLSNIAVQQISLVPGAVRIQANIEGNIAMQMQDFKF